MRVIFLTRGKFAKVDDADYDWLNQWKWHARNSRDTWYAARTTSMDAEGTQRCILMHRELAAQLGLEMVDHRNGDGLDNQRHNLRPCSRAQNAANRKIHKNNQSGFRGVRFDSGKYRLPWRADIQASGKREYLGNFACPAEAARAYNERATALFGDFARLNTIPT